MFAIGLRKFNKYLALFLLAISSLFVLPKEIVHEFCDHHDTEDVAYAINHDISISAEHQHCEVLQIFYQPYSAFVVEYDFTTIVQDAILNTFYHPDLSSVVFSSPDIRGPPTVI